MSEGCEALRSRYGDCQTQVFDQWRLDQCDNNYLFGMNKRRFQNLVWRLLVLKPPLLDELTSVLESAESTRLKKRLYHSRLRSGRHRIFPTARILAQPMKFSHVSCCAMDRATGRTPARCSVLGRFAADHPWWICAAWVVAAVVTADRTLMEQPRPGRRHSFPARPLRQCTRLSAIGRIVPG